MEDLMEDQTMKIVGLEEEIAVLKMSVRVQVTS